MSASIKTKQHALLILAMTTLLISMVFLGIRVYGLGQGRLLPDMRELVPHSVHFTSGQSEVREGEAVTWFTKYMWRGAPSSKPFRSVIGLDRPIRAGDRFFVEGTYEVGQGRQCLMTYVSRNAAKNSRNTPDIDVVIQANNSQGRFQLEDISAREPVVVKGIEPDDGEVNVRLEIRSSETDTSFPLRQTQVEFEYLYFWSC